jgi:hypothetical protein
MRSQLRNGSLVRLVVVLVLVSSAALLLNRAERLTSSTPMGEGRSVSHAARP